MPRISITPTAVTGLARCRQFLTTKNPLAGRRAAKTIQQQFALLQTSPEIGRPLETSPHIRELLIPFGDSGYVALYYHDVQNDEIVILAFRHQKEAGY